MKFFSILLVYIFLNTNIYAETNQSEEMKIFKNLRCLICQGQSIADSNSEFSQTIKLVVKDQIKEGKTEKEIYNFLIEKYGEWIFYKPNLNKVNFMLWLIPYSALIIGGIIIFRIVKKRKNI
tara:strand:+ start:42 stop:407 length:366 start_codon:yes stop_codon:yes gene_type:complete